MIKVAAIFGESAGSTMTQGCTPCECGDTAACLQESLPWLQILPRIVMSHLFLFGQVFLLLLVPTVVFFLLIKFFGKSILDVTQRFIAVVLGNILIFLFYITASAIELELWISLIVAQLFIGIIFFIVPIKNKRISIVGFGVKYTSIIICFFLILSLVRYFIV